MKNKKRGRKGELEKEREREGRKKYNMEEQTGKECFPLKSKAHSFFHPGMATRILTDSFVKIGCTIL